MLKTEVPVTLALVFLATIPSSCSAKWRRPKVEYTIPFHTQQSVSTNTVILIKFRHRMREQTVNTATVQLRTEDGKLVGGEVIYDPVTRIAEFKPNAPLAPNTLYTGSVSRDVEGDDTHFELAHTHVWSFTTASASTLDPFAQVQLEILMAQYDVASQGVMDPVLEYEIARDLSSDLVLYFQAEPEPDTDLMEAIALGIVEDDVRQSVRRSSIVSEENDYFELELLQLLILATDNRHRDR